VKRPVAQVELRLSALAMCVAVRRPSIATQQPAKSLVQAPAVIDSIAD